MGESEAWFQRFFGEEYLLFDEHRDTPGEVAFIRRTLGLKPRMRVLDLCCGYGRHALPLARQGARVVGLDLSPVLLEEARRRAGATGNRQQARGNRQGKRQQATGKSEKHEDPMPHRLTPDSHASRLQLVRADVRRIPFTGAFDRAISMFTSIGYFEDETENFSVLKGMASALKPGGKVLIETVNRDAIVRHFQPGQVYRPGNLTVVEERQFDPISGRSRVDVTVIREGTETRLHHSIRVYAFTELEMLLMACGLEVEGVWGDFQGGAFSWNAASMIVLARKTA